MRVIFNTSQDTLRILLSSAPIFESETVRDGIVLDFDLDGKIVGLELSTASRLMTHAHPPCTFEVTCTDSAAYSSEADSSESKSKILN